VYADILTLATVEGHLGQNLDTTSQPGTTLFDTGAQTGSPVSTILSPWNFTCSTCTGYGISASGAAYVTNGSLGANSTVMVTGSPGPHFLSAADDTADYVDTLTITGGSGSGVLVLQYALDGSISHTGTGVNVSSFLSLANPFATDYQLGSGAVNGGTEADFFGDGATNGTVTFYIPFTYGTAFGTELTMDAFAGFGSGGDTAPFTATVDFYNTAALNSALVFSGTPLSLGAENTGADISSASGISYGPNGTSAVPEPGSWFLLASAMGVLALAKRLRVLESPRRSKLSESFYFRRASE
jgi:hypothetical protein